MLLGSYWSPARGECSNSQVLLLGSFIVEVRHSHQSLSCLCLPAVKREVDFSCSNRVFLWPPATHGGLKIMLLLTFCVENANCLEEVPQASGWSRSLVAHLTCEFGRGLWGAQDFPGGLLVVSGASEVGDVSIPQPRCFRFLVFFSVSFGWNPYGPSLVHLLTCLVSPLWLSNFLFEMIKKAFWQNWPPFLMFWIWKKTLIEFNVLETKKKFARCWWF